MFVREALPKEMERVYQMGYHEWSKNRTYDQYVFDNKKEDQIGIRYVYIDEQKDEIIGSFIMLPSQLKTPRQAFLVKGLGSIVIRRDRQGMGFGKKMLEEYFTTIEKQKDDTNYLLFSDIDPTFYMKFNFRKLPNHLQRYSKSVCMVRCKDEIFNAVISGQIEDLPTYF